MAQSLTKILVHLVFSTQKRNSWLDEKISSELYPYISKILENHNCSLLRIGGTENHIHILCVVAKNLSIGKVVEEIKTGSSKWIKTKDPKYKEFYWQHGLVHFRLAQATKRLPVIILLIKNSITKPGHLMMSFVVYYKNMI